MCRRSALRPVFQNQRAKQKHTPVRARYIAQYRKEKDKQSRDTHHLTGGTIQLVSPVLLQLNRLVSLLLLQMRMRTSYDRYYHSWAHPAILPSTKARTTERWRILRVRLPVTAADCVTLRLAFSLAPAISLLSPALIL